MILALLACDSDPAQDDSSNSSLSMLGDTDTGGSVETDVITDTAVGTELTGDATIWSVCGPTDGDAIRLSVAQIDAECAIDGSNPRNAHPVTFFLWAALPTAEALPYTMSIGEDFDAGGNATYNPTPSGPTYAPTIGSVTFTSYTGGASAQGTWTLTLDDGTTLYGDFDAAWCEYEPVCR